MAATSNNYKSDDFHKLLLVVKDLSQQLDENRQATMKLKLHADVLKVCQSTCPCGLLKGTASSMRRLSA